jgi:hypothetical protein
MKIPSIWTLLISITTMRRAVRAGLVTETALSIWTAMYGLAAFSSPTRFAFTLREKTVRRLNRTRSPDRRLHFVSKTRLARQILTEPKPLLPDDFKVYVLFDSWYAAARLLKFIHRQGWYTICALKSNRKLNGQRLDRHNLAQRHRRYTPVTVAAADGKSALTRSESCLAAWKMCLLTSMC